MRHFKIPKWLRRIYPEAIWDFSFQEGKSVYLTFDDGPHPEVTPTILDILNKFNAKATFFCAGKNAEKFPELIGQLKSAGHQIANHGFEHLNSKKLTDQLFLENVIKGKEITNSNCFRPPYGKITRHQYRLLRENGIQLVLWTAMSYDFDSGLPSSKRIKKMKEATQNGCIFVFHDNIKSLDAVKNDLPILLKYWLDNNYTLKTVC